MSLLKVHLLLTFLKVIYILQTDKWINKTVFAKPKSTTVILMMCLKEQEAAAQTGQGDAVTHPTNSLNGMLMRHI